MSMRPDDHRRKWDRTEYERKALDRAQKQREQHEKKSEDEDPDRKNLTYPFDRRNT